MDRRRGVLVGLGLIVLLGAGLRLYQLGAGGYGNLYYAAAVKSMLGSWHNFFFVAFEPGGSVSVDKPPLGLWIEAGSALILGFNGFALALPNALAGVLSIPLLYKLVRRPFGAPAALTAALVLAVMPITIATERNNTIDGMLTFAMLLAAWGFAAAAESGRLRSLLLGVVALGLGFNIKMLEAFMPLPAFYMVYLLGALSRRKRLAHLALASLVLLGLSFAWPLAVDLTPPAQRPYVGSSTDNSEFGLIFGWNGISRLISNGTLPGLGAAQPPASFPTDARPSYGASPGFGNDVPPGPLRLFSQPLAEEASWLLPGVILALPLVLLALYRRRKTGRGGRAQGLGLALWGAWLGAEGVYFSYTTGLFHPYYLIMFGPPLAALAGMAVWAASELAGSLRRAAWGLAALAVAGTALYQVFILKDYPEYAGLAALVLGGGLGGLALLGWSWLGNPAHRQWPAGAALALLCIALLAASLAWSADVALNPRVDQTGLPSASQYLSQTGRGLPGGFGGAPPPAGLPPLENPPLAEAPLAGMLPAGAPPGFPAPSGGIPPGNAPSQINSALIAYLEANTPESGYLLAVNSAQEASPIVLATGRPVLTFGGFTGADPVIDTPHLADLVAQGRLRFILASSNAGPGLARQKPDLWAWIQGNCRTAAVPAESTAGETLLDCQ